MGSETKVARRQVFYIPGYDPIHPRRYRELYRKEAARQAEISGFDLKLSPKRGGGRYGWHVDATLEGAEVVADVEVLVWSDIVRDSMDAGVLGTYWQLIQTSALYIGTGALRRLMWLRKGPVAAALYPIVILLGQLLAGCLAALAAFLLLGLIHPLAAWFGLAALPAVLLQFKKHDNKIYAYYLMHDYAYSARWKGANPPELETRMAEFGDVIAAALTSDVDEVLVVGHSSGAHLGVSILADLIRAGRVPANGPALGFLTLGQVVPMVSFLPKADRLRGDLRFLSERNELAWVDVTAPGDGCAFALCDPVAVSGVATEKSQWPLIISAAFSQTMGAELWEKMRRKYFKLHFQYMCAFPFPKDYDYFRVTAGPRTLRDRYRGRKHSKSRIDLPASKYTSVAA